MATAPKVLRYTAFVLMMLCGIVGGAFLVGETMMDPGGATGVVLSVLWVAPTAAMAGYAFLRPYAAATVLTVLAGVVAAFVMLDVLFRVVPRDRVGPVGSVAVFAVAMMLAFLGLHRPTRAGVLLLLVGAANLAGVFAEMLERDGAPLGVALGGSSGAVAIPVLVVGALFLLAGWSEPRRSRPDGTFGPTADHVTEMH